MKKTAFVDAAIVICGIPILYGVLRYLRGAFDGSDRVFAYLIAIIVTLAVLRGLHCLIHGKSNHESK